MQAGYSELEFLRRRSGTVSSLISKFATGVQQPVVAVNPRRENRRHTIVGVGVPVPAVPPQTCGSRDRSNSGAFLATVLARRVSRTSQLSTANPVTLQDCSNMPTRILPNPSPKLSVKPQQSHNSSKMYKKQQIINDLIIPHSTFTTSKPLTFKAERKFKDSTIDDLKRRTEQRKSDLNRVQSMPNGGTSGAAAARAKFYSKIGEDPNNRQKAKIQRSNTITSGTGVKSLLLKWCQARVKSYPIEVNNYSGSWADGSAFCALIHSFFPDAYNWDDVYINTDSQDQRRKNFNLAFDTALEKADAEPLIEVGDMLFMGNRPDAKCIFCYLQSLYNKLKKFEKPIEPKKKAEEEVDV